MVNISRFEITRGAPSSTMVGNPNVTDLPPKTVSFVSDWLKVADDGGLSSWTPASATVKNGGVWLDSPVMPGRVPLSMPAGNVIETFECILQGEQRKRAEILSDLWQIAKAAQDYWAEDHQPDPVYLTFEGVTGEGVQHALVYSVDIAYDADALYNPDINTRVTFTIEREPAWRYTVAPGDNPRKYALESRGMEPASATVGTAYYDYTNLNLLQALSGNWRGVVEGTIKNFDEFLVANRNYIEIPATSIPGDAPALALVSWVSKMSSGSVSKLHMARSTRRDLFPLNNSNVNNARFKNTFNGGDATILTPTNITVTKPIVATGLISNGSAVNRHVLRCVYAAGAVSSQRIGSFTKLINQYPGRYAAYMRAAITAGVGTNVLFYLEYSYGSSNINLKFSNSARIQAAGFQTIYLGVVDFTTLGNKLNAVDGTGLDIATTFNLYLSSTKTTADTPTIEVYDIVLMPIDEPNGIVTIDFAALSLNDPVFVDKTGYFNLRAQDVALTRQSSQNAPRQLNGQGIELIPGVANRIYFMAESTATNPADLHEVRVDLVPRTYGIREK